MNDGSVAADRHARRPVRAAGAHIRRLFHRLAGHEPHARQGFRIARARRRRRASTGRALPGPAKRRARAGRRPAGLHPMSSVAGVPVRVRRVDDLGRKRLACVTLGAQQIVATVPPGMSPIGDQASVVIRSRRILTSTSTTSASRERRHDRQAAQQPRLALRPAGPGVRPVLGAAPDHDGRELFGPGHDGREQFLLERRRLVSRSSEPEHGDRGALQRRAVSQPRLLARRAPDRGAARHRDRSVHTAKRLAGRTDAGRGGAADAHSVERGRHDVADLRARRHRPVRRDADRTRPALQCDAGSDFRLDHHRRHRRLALDAARHSPELRGLTGDPRRLLSGRPDRRREPLGDFLQYRIAEAAEGARHRRAASLHADAS